MYEAALLGIVSLVHIASFGFLFKGSKIFGKKKSKATTKPRQFKQRIISPPPKTPLEVQTKLDLLIAKSVSEEKRISKERAKEKDKAWACYTVGNLKDFRIHGRKYARLAPMEKVCQNTTELAASMRDYVDMSVLVSKIMETHTDLKGIKSSLGIPTENIEKAAVAIKELAESMSTQYSILDNGVNTLLTAPEIEDELETLEAEFSAKIKTPKKIDDDLEAKIKKKKAEFARA